MYQIGGAPRACRGAEFGSTAKVASVFFPAVNCARALTSEDDATEASSSEGESTAVRRPLQVDGVNLGPEIGGFAPRPGDYRVPNRKLRGVGFT